MMNERDSKVLEYKKRLNKPNFMTFGKPSVQ
jgi:hypothetical protein